jgi:hypothetical protein
MKSFFSAAYLAALVLAAAPNASPAHSAAMPPMKIAQTTAPIVRAGCYNDCWHSRWRSHYRWGSSCCGENWHSRWRSHYRWGSSYGWYEHSRWRSHYRWGSYHRLWRHGGGDTFYD